MSDLLESSAFYFDVSFERRRFGDLERVVGDVDDGSEAVARVKRLDGVVRLVEALEGVRHVRIDVQLAPHHSLD